MSGARALVVCGWVVLLLGACHEDPAVSLSVEVRTDLVPSVDFDDVLVEVLPEEGESPRWQQSRTATRELDFVAGARVAELTVLEPARRRVVVTLRSAGAPAVRRTLLVDHREDLVLTVVLIRSCLDGCVDEIDECETDADCAAASECAKPTCAGGACLQVPDHEACLATGYCDPFQGCGEPRCSGTDCAPEAPEPGRILISELRTRGPGGADDEHVEIRNQGEAVTVGPAGWAIVAPTGGTARLLHAIPPGTVIPARGTYLAAGAGWSLGAVTAPDGTLRFGLDDEGGLGLFATTVPNAWSLTTRIDAVGLGATAPLFREGEVLRPYPLSTEAALVRRVSPAGPIDVDSQQSRADWVLVETRGAQPAGFDATLGAPSPQSSRSELPVDFGGDFLDPTVTGATPPNRESLPEPGTGEETAMGQIAIRRRLVNTDSRVWRSVVFRVTRLTTLASDAPSGQADLRILDAPSGMVLLADGTTLVPVIGLTVPDAPDQSERGAGLETMLRLPLPPEGLAPGESVAYEIRVGVARSGSFEIKILTHLHADPMTSTD